MKGSKPVPVNITVYYKDGSTQTLHQSIAVWENSSVTSLNFTTGRSIDKIVLCGVHDADSDPSNNEWKMK
jgi:hypothetical protein